MTISITHTLCSISLNWAVRFSFQVIYLLNHALCERSLGLDSAQSEWWVKWGLNSWSGEASLGLIPGLGYSSKRQNLCGDAARLCVQNLIYSCPGSPEKNVHLYHYWRVIDYKARLWNLQLLNYSTLVHKFQIFISKSQLIFSPINISFRCNNGVRAKLSSHLENKECPGWDWERWGGRGKQRSCCLDSAPFSLIRRDFSYMAFSYFLFSLKSCLVCRKWKSFIYL